MKRPVLCLLILCALAPSRAHAQASSIPSAQPTQPSGTDEQRGRAILNEMVDALGGPAWRERHDMQAAGRTASFFHNQPNGTIIEFDYWRRYPNYGQTDAERYGFLTDKSMIFPGKKIDVVQIWTRANGYEVTFKGRTELPKDQVEDYERRKAHSVDAIINTWLKTPGVMVLSEGTSMVMRRIADKVTVLSPNNDAVTLEIDASTHLPLRRTFQWRNVTFKDYDEDVEEYDDYHTVDGLPTAYTLTRYHNGDMVNQRFYTKVHYNLGIPNDMFDPDHVIVKKK
ncbi:hypothetical protein [Edaphobacter bradus]|uniref:hypothetical protein n=1 Tax=Edaphobacter bradus TaxID=2259016 RepID=UPI0021E0A4DF|nr:hypothetical protein [Edaphobacter bradus]